MKNLIKPVLITCVVVLVISCEAKRTVNQCLDEPNQRAAIYEQILTNSKYANEFAHVMMMGAERGKDLALDTNGMGRMMDPGNMMMACARDSVMCDTIAGMMMQNGMFMHEMMERMYLQGILDERCVGHAMRRMEMGHTMMHNGRR